MLVSRADGLSIGAVAARLHRSARDLVSCGDRAVALLEFTTRDAEREAA